MKPPAIAPMKFDRNIEEEYTGAMAIGLESEEPKKINGENKNYTFVATLLSGGPDDTERRFVITFYCIDDTIIIMEPPIRNSGFNGGCFLSRRKIKKPSGDLVLETDFFVGGQIQLLKHRFLLIDANEGTYKLMDNNFHKFVRTNFYAILNKIRSVCYADALDGRLAERFLAMEDEANSGMVNKSALIR